LTITERTAKAHVSSILGKLGASDRTEAVTLALRKGLIKL
jgi:two-component system NarL family response regulator